MKVKIKIEKVSNGYIISNEEINVRRIGKDEKDAMSHLSEAIEDHLLKTKSPLSMRYSKPTGMYWNGLKRKEIKNEIS